MPRGFRHIALSISFLSPMVRRPEAFFATNMASLILRPDLRFLALTSFQSFNRPSLSLGSSSRISRRRQSFSVSRPRRRPPGNIHSRSRLLLTSKTRPRLAATSLDDFAIIKRCRLTTNCRHNFIAFLPQRKATSPLNAASERRCSDGVAFIAAENCDRRLGGRCRQFAEVLHRGSANFAFASLGDARRNVSTGHREVIRPRAALSRVASDDGCPEGRNNEDLTIRRG